MRYLAIIFALGLIVSALTHVTPRSSPANETVMVNAADSAEGTAASGANSDASSTDGSLELQRNADGHFYADVQINGTPAHMLVDTGATVIALSRDDARRAGVATSIGAGDVIGRGADGDVHGDVVTLDRVELGSAKAEKMPAIVLSSGEQSLLGQSFLKQFKSVSIEGDKMVLR